MTAVRPIPADKQQAGAGVLLATSITLYISGELPHGVVQLMLVPENGFTFLSSLGLVKPGVAPGCIDVKVLAGFTGT